MAPFICPARGVIVSIIALAALALPGSAIAITGKDLTHNFSSEMRKGYIAGLVDMHSYEAVLDGNRERARCINDAFYRNDEMLTQLVDVMLTFPDKEPVQIMVVVMNKACGS